MMLCLLKKENRRLYISGTYNYDCRISSGRKGNDDQCYYELHAMR